ncbi:transposase [Methylomarinum sp. Ch1-1]|uniref:Transposase n=1 Tax=Methylomarinum roseum TaxID=3067653 RepID=A0AAU7NPP1_9GAMM|nr:transposase [Methylomarinum sp. Ch1-1]MDP4521172.1 transposase [Methylomarinum sp. Ch1-1]
MSNYRRNWVAGGCYFFTVNLMDRRRSLLTDHIDLLRDSVRRIRRLHPFHIDAWVVLPDHMHCIWTLPDDTDDYAIRWRLIKLLFSKGLPKNERLPAVRRRRSERGIWQRRYWEHTILTAEDYARHVDYIHANPLKHGHVARAQDWPYSSFHRYVEQGVLPPNWCGDTDDLTTAPD